jgi:chromosome partitioning protein
MHILPATIDLAGAEIDLVSMMLREYVLKRLLSRLPDYDHVLIDCPPSLGLLTVNALAASDFALIPVQCSYLSWRGLPLLGRTISKIRAVVNPSLRPLGILPTLFDGRTTHAHETLELLRLQRPGEVLPFVIKSTVRAQEAAKAGLSLIDFDPRSEAALTYLMLAEEVDRVAREKQAEPATSQSLPGGGQGGAANGAAGNVPQA